MYKFQTVNTFPINCSLHLHLFIARLVSNVVHFCESFAMIQHFIKKGGKCYRMNRASDKISTLILMKESLFIKQVWYKL